MKNPETEQNDPCFKEQQLTYKCFNVNNFDKSLCQAEMANYKTCTEFWYFVKKERRRQNIKPYLPPLEEREDIKKQFLSKFNQKS